MDLAARKGLSLYTTDNSEGTVSVSPFANDSEQAVDGPEKPKALQKGDFIHKVDDMLAILFPHMFEDLEFLLPSTDEGPSNMELSCDIEMSDAFDRPLQRGGIQGNAIAGPSRLL